MKTARIFINCLSTFFLLVGLSCGAVAAVVVDCAYYHADVGPLYAWSETAAGITDFSATDRRAGLLKVFVRNEGTEPVRVEAEALNGESLQALRENERHEVIWARTFPPIVPPKGLAEVSVRLRYPLQASARLRLKAGPQRLEATISPPPPPFRIETIAWREDGKIVWLVAQQHGPQPGRIGKIFVDGVDVTTQTLMPAPSFVHGICPLEIRLSQPLTKGSFHTYKLVNDRGVAVACTLRTLEEFMPLGLYGPANLEEAVKAGWNTIVLFGRQDRASLDRYAAYGLRCGFYVGGKPVEDVVQHSALYAYFLRDEPDCGDYFSSSWPHPLRIGYLAPDCVRDMEACFTADPVTPVAMTLDLTYKPANYYVYSQIPDIVTPDCYPLAIGQPLSWIREVTHTCRLAAGPRRVDMIPQVGFEDRKKEKMKFPRPPFDREIVIQYLYALGAGARGFLGWEAFNEESDSTHFYGAPNFPDVMNALSQTFQRFKLLEPLILQAHPTDLARCDNPRVWTRTLICGLQALLIVLVNDAYESLAEDFAITPQKNVTIRIPKLPWLQPFYAARVDSGRFQPISLQQTSEGFLLRLSELDTGEIFLLAADIDVAQALLKRYQQEVARAGAALIAGYQAEQRQRGRTEALTRYIMGRFKDYAYEVTTPLNAYGTERGGFFNPQKVPHPGLEWWTESTPRGGEWKISIPESQGGKKHKIYFQTQSWWGGGHLRIEIWGPDKQAIMEWDGPERPRFLEAVEVTLPQAGDYTIRILQAGAGKPGGRLSRFIYVVPETAGPWPMPYE